MIVPAPLGKETVISFVAGLVDIETLFPATISILPPLLVIPLIDETTFAWSALNGIVCPRRVTSGDSRLLLICPEFILSAFRSVKFEPLPLNDPAEIDP